MTTLSALPSYVLIFVVIGITLVVGANVIETVQDDQTANGIAYNISTEVLTALETMGNWQNILAIVVISAVVIGVISIFFQPRRGGA